MAVALIKESASLIVISRCGRLPHIAQTGFQQGLGAEDYELLLLKRNRGNKFMPSACVFPGGAYDPADSAGSWVQLFAQCGFTQHALQQQFRLSNNERASLYRKLAEKGRLHGQNAITNGINSSSVNDANNNTEYRSSIKSISIENKPSTLNTNDINFDKDNKLSEDTKNTGVSDNNDGSPAENISYLMPELSLRITALRETFEETGLLLAAPVAGGVVGPALAITETNTTEVVSGDTVAEGRDLGGRSIRDWRDEVEADASKFVDMFAATATKPGTALLPWCWGLKEWWSWLTPQSFPARRYDTMFYTVLLQRLDGALLSHSNESDSLKVLPPTTAIRSWLAGNIILAPPQVYELGRLHQFREFKHLNRHISSRGAQAGRVSVPVDTWCPQLWKLADGVVSILPGDSLYSDGYSTAPGVTPSLDANIKQLRHCAYAGEHVKTVGRMWKTLKVNNDGDILQFDNLLDLKHNRIEFVNKKFPSVLVSGGSNHGQVAPVDLVKKYSNIVIDSA